MQGIPHHLLDVRDPGQSYDVRQFQQLARASIRDILNRGHLPILCGGTGLYLKAALYDYEFEEQPEDPVLKAQLESMTNEELHTRLKREDPESAGKIHPNNRKRVIRALMIASSGKTKSGREKEQAHAPLFDVFWLGLEKQDNDARLLGRIRDMAAAGLEQEVRGLFADPASWSSTAFQGIGYKDRTLKDSVPGMRSWSRFIYTPGSMPDDREPGSRIRCPCAGMIRWIQKR
jgi:tRNA dimethylallyltransferase